MLTGCGEDQVAIRPAGIFARRLHRAPRADGEDRPWAPRGSVLVTGGTGAVGGHVARWLARPGAASRVILASRSGPGAPGAAALAAELATAGTAVSVLAVQVEVRAEVAGLLAWARAGGPPLTAVMHAAGTGETVAVADLTVTGLAGALAAKAAGAAHLDELTAGTHLEAFVLFSSASATWGSGGQAAYGAANAFLDALAAHRRARGLAATSVAWGPWAGAGMASGDNGTQLARRGLPAMDPALAVRALGQALGRGEALVTVADVDWARFAVSFTVLRPSPLLADLPEAAQAQAAVPHLGPDRPEGGSALARQLAPLSEAEQVQLLTDLIRAEAAGVLGHRAVDAVDAGRAFKDLGFDSVTAVDLRNRLTAVTGLQLPATLVFDYPTPATAASFLRVQVLGVAAAEPSAPGAAASEEPMAIVGMGCRYPGGVDGPDSLWDLLAAGTDAISPFPEDRGWDTDQASFARAGGFVPDAAGFDAEFFGISPREAMAMDPQQRMLLETSWEALERAGIAPASLRGSRTGVFAGAAASGYGAGAPAEGSEGYLLTGSQTSVVSGRVSYVLGLEGPAVTVDTACSSSLVALHLACQSLRAGECTLALAGGVAVIVTPGVFEEFARQQGLAADGRCKAYAEAADGTGWAEGAGVVVLERLSDARRNGHRVLAVVAGSAVNQDGASNGLTAPNGPSQQRVIRAALACAGLSPADVDVVEGHGTGTRLGDPIEAQALLATYGQDRDPGRPVLLGSVKSNIGHAQAAAGVAGVIKMVTAIAHGTVPATLHADEPSQHVNWSSGAVRLVTEAVPWPEAGRPRRAGVSSFGVSGTNAHVILAEAPVLEAPVLEAPVPEAPVPEAPIPEAPVPEVPAPEVPAPEAPARLEPAGRSASAVPWLVSARSAEAVRAQAARLARWVADRPGLAPADVGWSLASTRSAFEHRAVVTGHDREELAAGLAALAAGETAPGLLTGTAGQAGKLAFLFTGQAAQRPGMGRGLYAAFGVFAAAFDEACGYLDAHLGGSVAEAVRTGAGLDETMWAQPALFATQVALARLLASWGLTPDVVTGHSVGEVTAAHVAGVWSLEDACRVVAARGTLMQALPRGGAMAAIGTSEERVREVLARFPGAVIAALNGPRSVVISGEQDAVRAVTGELADAGARTRRLRVSHAFHSPLMDPILDDFAGVMASVTYREPRVPLVSALTGALATAEVTGPEHWARHVSGPVLFADAVATLRGHGVRTFVELGMDAVLSALGPRTQPVDEDRDEAWLPLLRRDRDERRTTLAAVAQVHARGVPVDWAGYFAGSAAAQVDLPTYAFRRQRYWLAGQGRTDATGLGQLAAGHPLLGAAVDLPSTGGLVLTGRLSLAAQPWLAEHVVGGRVLLPGTGFADLAVRAADQAGCGQVEELLIEVPLVLPARGGVDLQVTVAGPDQAGRRELAIYSRAAGAGPGGAWTRHAAGTLAPAVVRADGEGLVPWPPAEAAEVDLAGFYPALAGAGLAYGPAFQGVRAAWRRGEEVFAEVALPEGTPVAGFGVHPALLDAALQVTGLAGGRGPQDGPVLPFAWTQVAVHASGATTVRVRVSPAPAGDAVSVLLADPAGDPVASVGSLVLRPLPAAGQGGGAAVREALFRLDWTPAASVGAVAAERLAVLGPDAGLGLPGALPYRDLAELAAAVAAGQQAPDAVAACCVPGGAAYPVGGTGTGSMAAVAGSVAAQVLGLVQAWLAEPAVTASRLLVVTQRAVDAGPEAAMDLAGAAVWGLVRTAATENPGRFVLADADAVAGAGELVAAGARLGEPEFAVRGGQLRVPRLARAPVPAQPAAAQPAAAQPAADPARCPGTALWTAPCW